MLWAKAETRETLVSDFVAIAILLGLPEKDAQDQNIAVAAVTRWLDRNTNWLFILDNADDLAIARKFLPSAGTGHTLLTTRARNTGAVAERIEIEDMEPDEGALFLLRRAQILARSALLDAATANDRETARTISITLGGLPLALDQAGAFILETPSSLAEYLALYKQEGAKLLAQRGELPPDDHPSVTITFSLAFQKVEEKSKAAADLIRACAFLAPDAIHEEIITDGGDELGENLAPIASKPIEFLNALKEAGRFSLIDRNSVDKTLDIHRLVQQVVKDTMDETIQHLWIKRTMHALNRVFPNGDFSSWSQCQRLLPHTLVCIDFIGTWGIEDEAAAYMLNQVGYYLQQRAHYSDALSLHKRALAIREQVLGPNHFTTTQSLNNLGSVYTDLGEFRQAEQLLRRSLENVEKKFGPDHPQVALSLNNLALLYGKQGKYKKAKPLLQRALKIDEKHFGPEHLAVALILNNLAGLYYNTRQYKQAEVFYRQALQTREKLLAANHPDVALSLNNLGNIYWAQGKFAQAEPLLQRALHIQEEQLGLAHPDVAQSLNNLGLLYTRQHRYLEAAQAFQKAITINEQTLGLKHLTVALTSENYAYLLRATNREAEAEKLEARARGIRGENKN